MWRLPAPFGYTVFCDDIRREVGNKISYMGAYVGSMVVPGKFPLTISRLILASTYVDNLSEKGKSISFSVYLPGIPNNQPTFSRTVILGEGVNLEEVAAKSKISGVEHVLISSQIFVLSPLVIERTGSIRVRVAKGDTETRVGSLFVQAGEDPSADAR